MLDNGNMTINDLTAPDQASRWQELKAFAASLHSQPKPPKRPITNTEFYAELDAAEGRKRESLTELRHRHLEKIDRIAKRADYERADYQQYLVEHYDRLFGALRGSKAKEVPSDKWRKSWMIGLLLDRVDARRAYFKRHGIPFTKF